MKNPVTRFLVILGLGSLAVLAIAQPGKGFRDHHEFNPARMLAHLSSELDLSVEQEAALSDIVQGVAESTGADRERLQQLRQQLRDEPFDAGRAQSAADEIGQITSRMVYTHASTRAQIARVLTPEQLAQMEAMRQERANRWEQRRDRYQQKRQP